MVAKERSGETGRSVSGRGESGQSSVEWVGLVLFVSGVFVALSVGGLTPSPAAVVHSIHRGILCAVAHGGSCPDGASIDHYGAEVAALVRRFEPEIAFRSELLGMPVGDDPDLAIASTANAARISSWKPTSTNCTRSVVVIPR